MQMCEHHWGMLRKAIEDRGLGHLITKTTADLIRSDPGTDPMFRACISIFGNTADLLGPEILRISDEDCPLCYLNRECACPVKNCADRWITYAARDEKDVDDIIRKKQAAIYN